jgi:hypothetical protein
LLLLASCARTPWEAVEVGGLDHFEVVEKSGGKGLATFVVEVEEQHEAFILTAQSERSMWSYVESIRDPSGEVVFDALALADGEESLTGAQYANPLSTVNWPIRAEDPPLVPGKWKVQVGPLNSDFFLVKGAEVAGSLTFKDTGSQATLRVQLVYADGTADDPELVRGTEEALAIWTDIYATHGIALEITEATYDGPLTESPAGGSGVAYEAIAAAAGVGVLPVVVLSDFSDWQFDIYGISGGIPGPLAQTPRTAVAINGLTNAGPDLVFSSEEIRIYAETLAHEVGHFVGIFHPVEDGWAAWDALTDTENCGSQSGCIGALGNNLMFPFPICGAGGTCAVQQDLTTGQRAVMNHYVGVR